MKRIALALLAGAALLTLLARALEPRWPAAAWLAAFAEAAMVGAIADWFAVVALFRHPLGLRIPHTAIVPTHKDRIGEQLGRFVVEHFLAREQLQAKLRAFDPAGRLADWLAEPANAARVGAHVTAAARQLLAALDDERVRAFLHAAVVRQLGRVDVAPLAGRLLGALTENARHQQLLDAVLRQVAIGLQHDAVRARIVELIAAEATLLRRLGLDQLAAQYAATKILAAVSRTVAEMGNDAAHPLRLRFDEAVQEFVERLRSDPAFRERGERLRDELLAQPALAEYLHGLWDELRQWLHDDLGDADSTIARRVAALARGLGTQLRDDAAMRQWLNAQIDARAPAWIERYREQLRRQIVERVRGWDAGELSAELERQIGRDLQFVRINGTLVGGLVGLAIHAATQIAR